MMKVLLINGSPHQHGCTFEGLTVVSDALQEEGIQTDFFWLGNKPVGGCIGCYKCTELKRCIFNDQVNDFVTKAADYDGFIFGSAVHYAGVSGNMKCFMDRVFFSAYTRQDHPMMFKPAAAVISARRSGTTPALDQLYKYFLHDQMPVISSRYWNMVHGQTPEDVRKDAEGLQTMRALGRNMAWFLKLKEAGEKAGITPPVQEKRTPTNFIR